MLTFDVPASYRVRKKEPDIITSMVRYSLVGNWSDMRSFNLIPHPQTMHSPTPPPYPPSHLKTADSKNWVKRVKDYFANFQGLYLFTIQEMLMIVGEFFQENFINFQNLLNSGVDSQQTQLSLQIVQEKLMYCLFFLTHVMLQEKNFTQNIKLDNPPQQLIDLISQNLSKCFHFIQFMTNLSQETRIYLMRQQNYLELAVMNFIDTYIQTTIEYLENLDPETPSPKFPTSQYDLASFHLEILKNFIGIQKFEDVYQILIEKM